MFFSYELSFWVRKILSSVEELPRLRLLLLSSLGTPGMGMPQLIHDFKFLGILHLLVLSGTQVNYFYRQLSWMGNVVFSAFPRDFRRSLNLGFISVGLLSFGFATGWQAPLTRSILLYFGRLIFPRLRFTMLVFVGLLAQAILFPEHLGTLSFLLSWGSFLILVVLENAISSKILRMLLISLACQILLCVALGAKFPSLNLCLLMLAANVGVGYLFDAFLMPLLGFVLALSFILCWAPQAWAHWAVGGVGWAMGPALNGAAQGILVGVKAFMYTL